MRFSWFNTLAGVLWMDTSRYGNDKNIPLRDFIEVNFNLEAENVEQGRRWLQDYPQVATGGPDIGCSTALGMSVFPYDDTANIPWPTERGTCIGISDPHTESCVKTVTAPPFTIWVKLPMVAEAATIVADTGRSGFDTRLQVYQGTSCTSLTCVTFNDDHPTLPLVSSEVTWIAQPGEQYWLKIDDTPCDLWNNNDAGDIIPLGLRIVQEPLGSLSPTLESTPICTTPPTAEVTPLATTKPETPVPEEDPTPAPVKDPPCNICGDDNNTIGKEDGEVTIPDPEQPSSTRTVTCSTLQILAKDFSFSPDLCMLTFEQTYETCECKTPDGSLVGEDPSSSQTPAGAGDSDNGGSGGWSPFVDNTFTFHFAWIFMAHVLWLFL